MCNAVSKQICFMEEWQIKTIEISRAFVEAVAGKPVTLVDLCNVLYLCDRTVCWRVNGVGASDRRSGGASERWSNAAALVSFKRKSWIFNTKHRARQLSRSSRSRRSKRTAPLRPVSRVIRRTLFIFNSALVFVSAQKRRAQPSDFTKKSLFVKPGVQPEASSRGWGVKLKRKNIYNISFPEKKWLFTSRYNT